MLTPHSGPRSKRTKGAGRELREQRGLLSPQLPQSRRDWSGCGLVALTLVMLASIVALIYYSDLIMPGVQVLDIELGSRSKSQAVKLLKQQWQERTVVLDGGDTGLTVNLPTLGMLIDAEATVQIAYERSRSLDRAGAALRRKGRISVSPILRFDAAVSEASLRALASHFYVHPVGAALRVTEGRVKGIPPVPGRALDPAATVAWLRENAVWVVATGRATPAFASVQPAIADVSALVEEANRWLSNPITIRVYDPITDQASVWTVSPEVWNAWLEITADLQAPAGLRWELDVEKARAFLAAQAANLGSERYIDIGAAVAGVQSAIETSSWYLGLRVYRRPGQHVVQIGETVASIARAHGIPYPWVQQANPGVGDALRSGQVLNIPSPDVLLPLPIIEHKRIVVSISQQAMWAYQDGAVVWVWPVSTGIPSSPTSPGVFQIQSHDPNAYAASWDLWMPYFMGIYRPVPASNFMNGFHGFPTRGGATLLWTGALGRPVTFGCILLSTANAAVLYEWAEEGVIVEVRP